MAFYGVANVQEQLQMTGEYSNPEQEYLFEWILKKTKPSNNFLLTIEPKFLFLKLCVGVGLNTYKRLCVYVE